MSNPHDEGWALCDAQPELIVAAVWHVAAKHYVKREDQTEFVNGYINRRRQMDERRREEKDDDDHAA